MKLTILDTGLSRKDPYVIVDENEKVLAASYEQNGEHSKTGLLRLTAELTTLRAQLAEARELIADAKVEIGFTLTGLTQPSNGTYNKLANYLKKVTTA